MKAIVIKFFIYPPGKEEPNRVEEFRADRMYVSHESGMLCASNYDVGVSINPKDIISIQIDLT